MLKTKKIKIFSKNGLKKNKRSIILWNTKRFVQLIQINGSRRGGMADALGSGPSSFTGVGVQLPPTAPNIL